MRIRIVDAFPPYQHQIDNVLQTSIRQGMVSMDYSLADLVKRDIISLEEANFRCMDKEVFGRYLQLGL